MKMNEVKSVYKQFLNDEGIIKAEKGGMFCGNIVRQIKYHEPQGEGDQHYCDIHFDDGETERVFRPDIVVFFKDGE